MGTWRMKFRVPSMGSMIQRVVCSPTAPNSSPRNPCAGNARPMTSRITRSAPRSASVTGVASGFMVTSKPVR